MDYKKMVMKRKLKSMIWLVAVLYALSGVLVIWKGFLHPDKTATLLTTVTAAPAYRIPEFPSLEYSLRVLSAFKNRSYHIAERTTQPLGKGFGFLKVHKAASSSTQALFLMYGWRRNMTFIIPYEENKYHFPNIISLSDSLNDGLIVPPPPNRSYEIVCHHVLYNRHAWSKYLPAHAPKMGTIRDPFTMFLSAISYFQLHKRWNITSADQLVDVLSMPSHFRENDPLRSFINNRMSIEYGVDPHIISKRDYAGFEKYVYEILDVDFTVVIVTEMFAESLVMMRRRLNWSLKDIVYLDKGKAPFIIKILAARRDPDYMQIIPTEKMRQLHKRFAIFDYMLYDFFRKRLEKQITQEEHFKEEVRHYKMLLKRVISFCVNIEVKVNISVRDLERLNATVVSRTMTVHATMWNERFEISRADCVLLASPELKITQAIRKRQYGEAKWYKLWG